MHHTKPDSSASKEELAPRTFQIGTFKITPRDIFVKVVILAIIFPLVMWAWNGQPLF